MIVLKKIASTKKRTIWFFIHSNLQKNTCSGFSTYVPDFYHWCFILCKPAHISISKIFTFIQQKKKKKIFPEFSLQKLIQMNFKVSTITKKKLTYIMNLNLLTQCIFAMLTTCTWIHTSMNHDNELAGILTSTSTLICFEFINVYCRTAQYFFRIMRGNCS